MTKMAEISKNRYSIYDQNSRKTIPFGAHNIYIARVAEYGSFELPRQRGFVHSGQNVGFLFSISA